MKAKLKLPAEREKLEEALRFVVENLERDECGMKAQMQIEVAVEELFVNIASYAYPPGSGSVTIEYSCENGVAEITLTDSGTPYDPLAKEDPDITLSVQERPIGGLGILMVKKTMDDMSYRSENGCNILTIKKQIK